MSIEKAKQELSALQAKMSAFSHAVGLISYDAVTSAPKNTAENRAQTLGILSEEIYRLSTGDDTLKLLEFLDANSQELDEKQSRMVFLLLRDIRKTRKIPMEEYIQYQKLMVESDAVWHEAKEKSDFALFEPVLERVFDFSKKIAAWVEPDMDPYDYWLNEFEEGLSKARCDEFFALLRSRIVPLFEKVQSRPQLSDEILHGHFPAEGQEKLAHWLMETMGIDMGHCGLATTEHPFTTSLGSHFDERITTKYHEDDVSSSFFSVIHEGGHALYDMGSDDSLAYTVLDGGVSMGIHESQSRFYENILGRSREFIGFVFPKLEELFPDQMKGYTADDLYRAVNRAQPGLIRIDADELSYALHIMVRYELEKKLFAGDISVHDLPGEWNRLYKEYLGVDVPDDAHGVLQDSHWSGGAIGYFPSYALGSAYGAQLLKKMKESVNVSACLEKGDFAPINQWNREHIWKHGCMYPPAQLLRSALGEEFDPNIFCDYLEEKFSLLYGI